MGEAGETPTDEAMPPTALPSRGNRTVVGERSSRRYEPLRRGRDRCRGWTSHTFVTMFPFALSPRNSALNSRERRSGVGGLSPMGTAIELPQLDFTGGRTRFVVSCAIPVHFRR